MISIKWSETAQKNALASGDVIVAQLPHATVVFRTQPFNLKVMEREILERYSDVWNQIHIMYQMFILTDTRYNSHAEMEIHLHPG